MNWTGTRNAIQVALSWGYQQKSEMGMIGWMKYLCQIDRSSKLNSDDLLVDGLEVGEILRAVSEQRPPVRQWLEFAYGPDRPDMMRAELAFTLAYDLFSTLRGRRFEKHRKLCEVALDDYAVRVTGDQTDPDHPRAFTPAMYCKLLDLRFPAERLEEEWKKDWDRKQGLVLGKIQNLDAEGVGHVSSTVRCLREERSMIKAGVKEKERRQGT